jgi:hypothetical protein
MSAPQDDPNQSTTLHLGRFAPGAQPPEDSTETSQTVVIKRAAAEIVEQSGQPVMSKDSGALPPKEMLGAVSYCYAKGVYTSEEIESKMLRDPQFREAVHGEVPDARAIRRFRRGNREAIKRTLEKAFRFMRKKQKREVQPLPGQPVVPQGEEPTGDSTVTFVRREAEKRLNEAAFIDNMSKD